MPTELYVDRFIIPLSGPLSDVRALGVEHFESEATYALLLLSDKTLEPWRPILPRCAIGAKTDLREITRLLVETRS